MNIIRHLKFFSKYKNLINSFRYVYYLMITDGIINGFKTKAFTYYKLFSYLSIIENKKIVTASRKGFVILASDKDLYIADYIKLHIEKFSDNVVVSKEINKKFDDRLYFILCPIKLTKLPENFISLQTKSITSRNFSTRNYIKKFKKSLAILDETNENIEIYNKHKISSNKLYFLPYYANEKCGNNLQKKYSFYFYRFLLANDIINFDVFFTLTHNCFFLNKNFQCLSLKEYSKRQKEFLLSNKYNIEIFNGLRYKIRWIGCGLSYKTIIKKALEQNLDYIIICEDDIEFYEDFPQRLSVILEYLEKNLNNWDVFSGFMADVKSDVTIEKIETFKSEDFIQIDRIISTVFNIYNKSIYSHILAWDQNNFDVENNTIDNYIGKKRDLRAITTIPFPVGHKDNQFSTIWGFKNCEYKQMLQNTINILKKKKDEFKRK